MRVERGTVNPVLDEDEMQRVLDITMHRVQETAWLESGAVHVFEADLQCLVDAVGSGDDATEDDDHDCSLVGRFVRMSPSCATVATCTPAGEYTDPVAMPRALTMP